MDAYKFDISKFTNLQAIGLHGASLDTCQRAVFLRILSTLNAPKLRQATLVFPHDHRFMNAKEMDECLAERFKSLELLVIECDGLHAEGSESCLQEIRDMFPQMSRCGMLRIQIHTKPFRY